MGVELDEETAFQVGRLVILTILLFLSHDFYIFLWLKDPHRQWTIFRMMMVLCPFDF